MVAHAFFKGLLFLGAGSVIHGLDDEQDLKRMGGLRRYMRWTTVTFTVGWLAIAGVPPLSGFWAKGDVLEQRVGRTPSRCGRSALAAALLTAYYMSRLFVLAFTGDPRFLAGRRRSPRAGAAPRVALGHAPAARRARGLRRCRRRARPVLVTPHLDASWPPSSRHCTTTTFGDGCDSGALATTDVAVAVIGVIIGWWLWRGRWSTAPRSTRRSSSASGTGTTSTTPSSAGLAQRAGRVRGLRWSTSGHRRRGQRCGHLATRRAARQRASCRTGYVRNYALGIAIGMALIVAFMLAGRGDR